MITRNGPAGSLLPAVERMAASGLVQLELPEAGPSIRAEIGKVFVRGDEAVQGATHKRVDGKLVAFCLLGGLGLFQFSRKQFLPAGLTLLLDAIALLEISKLKNK